MVGVRAARLIPARSSRAHDRDPRRALSRSSPPWAAWSCSSTEDGALRQGPRTAFCGGKVMPRLLLLVPTTCTDQRFSRGRTAARRRGHRGFQSTQVLEKFSPDRTVTLDFRNSEKGTKRIIDFARGTLSRLSSRSTRTPRCWRLRPRRPWACHTIRPAPSGPPRTNIDFEQFSRKLASPQQVSPSYRAGTTLPRWPIVSNIPVSSSRSRFRQPRRDPGRRSGRVCRRVLSYRKILNHAYAGSLAGTGDYILVEDYIPGTEVALEGLLDRGQLSVLALFDKPDPLQGPFFEETIYVTPSRLPARVQHAVTAATARAVAAVGLDDGPIHAELRTDEKGPVIIELAARSIGGLCSESCALGWAFRSKSSSLAIRSGSRSSRSSAKRGPQGS